MMISQMMRWFAQAHKLLGFLGGAGGKESACQCRRHRRCGFDHCVGKIPWKRKWQPTLVFLPGKFHGQRSLADYSPRGCKESAWLSTQLLSGTVEFGTQVVECQSLRIFLLHHVDDHSVLEANEQEKSKYLRSGKRNSITLKEIKNKEIILRCFFLSASNQYLKIIHTSAASHFQCSLMSWVIVWCRPSIWGRSDRVLIAITFKSSKFIPNVPNIAQSQASSPLCIKMLEKITLQQLLMWIT